MKSNKLYKSLPKNKKRRNEREKQRRINDIQFKIRGNLTNRIYDVLKRNKKSDTTINLLGCSLEFLKQHLESQFRDGMSWQNHGLYGWHIDHIRPCSSFDLSDPKQQIECFHYSNLQPLWAKDNLSKGAKLI